MTTVKQLPGTSISKVYSTFVGSALATSIIVMGNGAVKIDNNYDCSEQNGLHMEIELSESEDAEVFMVDNMGRESIISIQASIEAINKVVNDFYG